MKVPKKTVKETQVDTDTMTKERPIIMSGPMVHAILEGQKTQTRRVLKLDHDADSRLQLSDGQPIDVMTGRIPCPYGQPGDRLWVRETWRAHLCAGRESEEIHYRADSESCPVDGETIKIWRPSIFMPRWASRLILEIVNIRVERLQEISPSDALDEGAIEWFIREGRENGFSWKNSDKPYAVWAYQHLWDSFNAKRGFGWDKNPWVWVIEFKRVKP